MDQVASLPAGLAAWADTYPRQPGVDAEHYAFRIELSDTTDEIQGEARIDVVLRSGVEELLLDFGAGMSATFTKQQI